jgi:hypothetical protein
LGLKELVDNLAKLGFLARVDPFEQPEEGAEGESPDGTSPAGPLSIEEGKLQINLNQDPENQANAEALLQIPDKFATRQDYEKHRS